MTSSSSSGSKEKDTGKYDYEKSMERVTLQYVSYPEARDNTWYLIVSPKKSADFLKEHLHSRRSLTAHLLNVNEPQYHEATRSRFVLHLAAAKTYPPGLLALWLTSNTIYIESYQKLIKHMLNLANETRDCLNDQGESRMRSRLAAWLTEAYHNSETEDVFFWNMKKRNSKNGMDAIIPPECPHGFELKERTHLEGFQKIVRLFENLADGYKNKTYPAFMPLLEGAVVFWAIERILLDTWTWAAKEAGSTVTEGGWHESSISPSEELDDKALFDQAFLRQALIANWTSSEYNNFVDTLEDIVDEGFEQIVGSDEEKRAEVLQRAEKMWKEVLDAGVGFWPELSQMTEEE